ncbi:MAG: ABC transporter permease [Acidobacteriota bacterium]|nr:MAG: ABC transporter permease [Acidobacteriota bacterium]
MLGFILKRLLLIIPMALIAVSVTWALIRVAPGTFYSSEKKIPAAVEAKLREKYGLDDPWYKQYGIMLSNIARGDFGISLKYEGQPVNEIIARHLPYSAVIGLLAYLLALAIGLAAGTIAALRQNSAFDYASMSAAMLGLSVPNFVLGPLLVLVFSFWLYLLPPARWGGFTSLILPVVTLAAIYAAYIARLTRAGLLEVMRSDYIRTARAKGLSERSVILRHALRGGLLPVVSFTGPALAALLAGTVVVEKVFAIPGLGNIFIQSVLNRDEPLVLGIVAFISVLVMIFNLIVDIAYGFIDPRIRYE